MAGPSSPSEETKPQASPFGEGVPPLPENATPEQKDEHWFKYVYQGDKMPQLTWRAVLMGGFLGMAMSAANLYTTLEIGWAFGIAITACVLSFVMWNFIVLTSGKRVSQMSVLENACMASTASAAGYSTGSTIATMFGALVLLAEIPEGKTAADVKTWDVTLPWVVTLFTLCTGLMGVFLAIPMKRQMINHEQLPFPSGTAAAETLRSLYSKSADAVRKAYALVISLAAGLLIGLLRAPDDVLKSLGWLGDAFAWVERVARFSIRVPSEIEMHITNRLYPAMKTAGGEVKNFFPAGFAFEPSALLTAAGMIVGMRISLSLVISSLLLYCVVGPKLAAVDANKLAATAETVLLQGSQAAEGAKDPAAAASAVAASLKTMVDGKGLHDGEEVKKQIERTAKTTIANDADARVQARYDAVFVEAKSLGLGVKTLEEQITKEASQLVREGKSAPDKRVRLEELLLAQGNDQQDAAITKQAEAAIAEFDSTIASRTEAAGKAVYQSLAQPIALAVANDNAAKARDAAKAEATGKGWPEEQVTRAGEVAFQQNSYKPNFIWDWGHNAVVLTRWSLWGGTALMVFSSLTAVALQWKTLVRAFSGAKSNAGGDTAAMSAIEVPGSWMIIGMLPITIAMVWLQVQAFDVSWYAGVIAVAMSFVLSLVASRATGETDTTPIGAMGKVMQLMFAALAPKNVGANLASAGIAANSASSSADLLTDLKTGYLLGANPRKQFLAQFFGVFFGTVAIVPIWYLMVPTRAKLEEFSLPSTRAWEAVAKVLTKGIGELPESARYAILIGAGLGVMLPVIERLLPAKARKYFPSATGVGLAWVMPFQNAFSFLVGALITEIWKLLNRKSSDSYNIPVASGLIAGESLMAAALAIMATAAGLISRM